jgi:hypothetical protein
MRLSSFGVLEIDMSVAISYHASTGVVKAFLHGCTSQQQTQVRKQLLDFSALAGHPLLLPVLVAQMKLDILEQESLRLWNKLVLAEGQTGQTDVPAISTDSDIVGCAINSSKFETHLENAPLVWSKPEAHDFDRTTLTVMGILQLTSYAETHSQALLLSIEEMKLGINTIQRRAGLSAKSYIAQTSSILSERLQLLHHRTRVIMSEVTFVDKRAQAQQTAVCPKSSAVKRGTTG